MPHHQKQEEALAKKAEVAPSGTMQHAVAKAGIFQQNAPLEKSLRDEPAPLKELSEEEKVRFPGGEVVEFAETNELELGCMRRERILKTSFKYPYLRTEEIVNSTTGKLMARSEMVANQMVVTLPSEKDPQLFLKEFGSEASSIVRISKSKPIYRVTLNTPSLASLPKALAGVQQHTSQGITGAPDYLGRSCGRPENYGYQYQWGLWKNNFCEENLFQQAFEERYRLSYEKWLIDGHSVDVLSEEEKNSLQQSPFLNFVPTATDSFASTRGINAEEGWDVRTSAANVVVAVVDSGIRYTHESLKNNMWHNPHPDPVLHDIYGKNFINGSGDPFDASNDDGHGTHCAGIIGAEANGALGVVGVAWSVQLMACKWTDAVGNGTLSDVIEALDYAKEHGANIVSCSFGFIKHETPEGEPITNFGSNMFSKNDYQSLEKEIESLRDSNVIVVAGAGNGGISVDEPFISSVTWSVVEKTYPACFSTTLDNVISVAATDYFERDIYGNELPTQREGLAYYSNFGSKSISIAAPGVCILSTYHLSDNSYGFWGGTSMATPFVAGALALLKAEYPNAAPRELIQHLMATTDHLPTLEGQVKSGRLNLARALHTPIVE